MKVIIVEASGKIGREVDKDVSASHEVVRVGAASGDVRCDYTDAESVRSMFETVGAYDALVAGAGKDVRFRLFEELVDDDFRYGFERKFLSQIRLLSLGRPTIRDGGAVRRDLCAGDRGNDVGAGTARMGRTSETRCFRTCRRNFKEP